VRGLTIEYLIVVPVRFHRLTPSCVAAESAFCEHLRILRRMLAPEFTTVVVASPAMEAARFEREQANLGRVDEGTDGVRWVELYPGAVSGFRFWTRHFAPMLHRLWRAVGRAGLVHAGTSHNLERPFEGLALLFATWCGKPTVCVVDIDLRGEARMNFLAGKWSRKSLLLCRWIYDPLRELQLASAARRCSLVLLKSRDLCRDYGVGRPHVKYFLDAAFSPEHLIPTEAFTRKLRRLADVGEPLELVYFGRLAAYKGVDRCIEAVALARGRTSAPIRLHVFGTGEELERLRALVVRLDQGSVVRFHGALPFGRELFEALYPMHLLLAAPSSEDTPRSALDAMAAGIPILAFSTAYYSDLKASGAVDLVPWPSVEALAERIVHYAEDKGRLAAPARAGLAFARANTQEAWLRARVDWTLALLDREPRRLHAAGPAGHG
jgi:glycosyltransferase involved in cell wall biosynthesis